MSQRTHTVTVLPGDGVGPEVMAQAVAVLQAASRRFGFGLKLREGLIGDAALRAGGKALPPETLRDAKASDAVLVGPILGEHHVHADAVNHPKQGLIKLRAWLGSYATVRPIRSYAGLEHASPLAPSRTRPDALVVYDHSSGLFYGRPHGVETDEAGNSTATNTMIYTTAEIERTARLAFELARKRGKRVCLVDMAKLLETGRLWMETAQAVAAAFPDVELVRRDAQHFFYDLPNDAGFFDVVLSEMSLGHLIAAATMGLTGTFAVHPAAFLGGEVPLFQPSHGAAVSIAGRGEADPLGAIRAAALLLDLGLGETEAAAAIEAAVAHVLAHGEWPSEIAPLKVAHPLGTEAVGEAVLQRLGGRMAA